MDRQLQKYYRQIANALRCPRVMRDRFLGDVRRMVRDFLEERPEASFDELRDFLGEPEELAAVLLEQVEPVVIDRYAQRKRYIRRGSLAVLIVLLVASITVAACAVTIRIRIKPNITQENTIIIYEPWED